MIQQELLSTQALPEDTRKGLLELTKRMEDAFTRKDAKAIALDFAEDATCVNPGGVWASGRAEIEKLIKNDIERIIGDSRSKMELTRVRLLSPTLAFAELEHHLDRGRYPDGNVGPMDVHVVCLVRKNGSKWEGLDVRAHVYMKPTMLH